MIPSRALSLAFAALICSGLLGGCNAKDPEAASKATHQAARERAHELTTYTTPQLIAVFKDEKSSDREMAAAVLRGRPKAEIAPVFVAALSDKNERIQIAAANVVAHFHDPQYTPALIAHAKSASNQAVKSNAIAMLGHANDKAAIPFLQELLKTEAWKQLASRSIEMIEKGEK